MVLQLRKGRLCLEQASSSMKTRQQTSDTAFRRIRLTWTQENCNLLIMNELKLLPIMGAAWSSGPHTAGLGRPARPPATPSPGSCNNKQGDTYSARCRSNTMTDIDMISKILKTLRENGEEIMKKRAERLKSKRKKAAMLKK